MNIAGAISTAAGLLGLFGTASAVAVSRASSRRSQLDRVLSEASSLTLGDIAQARSRIGGAFENTTGKPALTPDLIDDFFEVLWAFERLNGLFQSFSSPLSKRPNPPQRLLLLSCRGAISVWNSYVSRGCTDQNGQDIDTFPCHLGVQELKYALDKLRPPK